MKKVILKNNKVELVLINIGASIYDLKYKGRSLVRQASSYYKNKEYIGTTVAPLAGRYNIDNEIILHSGVDTFHNKEFDFKKTNEYQVEFSLEYLKVIYTLSESGFRIDFLVKSNKKIPLNITNHSYFSLDDKRDINTHYIDIKSDYMSLKDSDNLAIGVRKNLNHRIDFSKQKVDDYYYFSDDGVFTLFSRENDISLEIKTSYPGVVLYTYNSPLDKINKHSAVAIECQYAPNNFILHSNYSEYIEYRIRG